MYLVDVVIQHGLSLSFVAEHLPTTGLLHDKTLPTPTGPVRSAQTRFRCVALSIPRAYVLALVESTRSMNSLGVLTSQFKLTCQGPSAVCPVSE
jgi:hypothetical protein